MLALCHPFGFLCFYAFFFAHLPTCSCLRLCLLVSSMLQSNGTMDAQSKPTFFLVGHPLLLNNILVFPFIRSICFVCPHLALYVLCSLSLSLVSLFACLLACFFCLCIYMHGAWTLGARVRPPRREQKRTKMRARRRTPTKGNVHL